MMDLQPVGLALDRKHRLCRSAGRQRMVVDVGERQHIPVDKPGTSFMARTSAARDKEPSWTASQALAMLATGDRKFAEPLADISPVRLAVEIATWASKPGRVRRDAKYTRSILVAAIRAGGRPGGVGAYTFTDDEPRRLSDAEVTQIRFHEQHGKSIEYQLRDSRRDVSYRGLRFAPADICHLYYENSTSKRDADAEKNGLLHQRSHGCRLQ